mmetsp:Transcript_5302/g.10542  ORF Transcript_5302/g.10542 Transcript_5302/m.10542 type:complete len:93 (+) Transcript_5302:1981-2259(+)
MSPTCGVRHMPPPEILSRSAKMLKRTTLDSGKNAYCSLQPSCPSIYSRECSIPQKETMGDFRKEKLDNVRYERKPLWICGHVHEFWSRFENF